MFKDYTRNHIVIKRPKGTQRKWRLHRSFATQGEGRLVAKKMKDEGIWEAKCILRKNLESYK